MKTSLQSLAAFLLSAVLLGCANAAPEDDIRAALKERLPNLPAIDEVSKTPMKGLYEVRVNGSEIFYTDAKGEFLIQGELIDTRARVNLTEKRQERLSALPFDKLPVKDAFTIVRGKGERQMAIFADPNCGFCKRYEQELATLDNVTLHVFLYPILGPDSQVKSQHIWCAADKGKAWEDWMLRGVRPTPAQCDTAALARNVSFGQTYRISGTPTTFVASGARLTGAVGIADVEKALSAR